ncbi:SRPBCC family protein [Glycomyces arizonensis]|uniref:SRPBCC family protein n=1 Tax=Glycomyces arizonensis TaxID=256035 RepID=UPI000402D9FC|nr:SRPBCC family protein [Glycomyces arizonensis]
MSDRSEPDVTVDIPASREDVFAILADGWNYPNWVVGASHVRAVDRDWPAPGTMIHHSVGPWPLHLDDVTEVVVEERPRLLVLDARLWPIGAARVRLELEALGEEETRIGMIERAVRGPIGLAPAEFQARLLAPRNRESLRRLSDLAVGRSSGVGPGDSH